MIERQLKLIDESGRTWKDNVQDEKVTYQVDEMIKYLCNDKAFWNVAKY